MDATHKKRLLEIVPSNDPLDSPEFDVTNYINTYFPNDESLQHIDTFMSKLELQKTQLRVKIMGFIKKQIVEEDTSTESINQFSTSIGALITRISQMEEESKRSRIMISDLSQKIQTLSSAKKNVENSIAILERIAMLEDSIIQLERFQSSSYFGQICNVLEPAHSLYESVKHLRGIPKVRSLLERHERLLKFYCERAENEYERLCPVCFETETHDIVQLDDPSDLFSSTFMAVCSLASACSQDLEQRLKKQFLETQFKYMPKSKSIEELREKIVWLRTLLSFFEQKFMRLFPLRWMMPISICKRFMHGIGTDIGVILNGTTFSLKDFLAFYSECVGLENELQKFCEEYVVSNSGDYYRTIDGLKMEEEARKEMNLPSSESFNFANVSTEVARIKQKYSQRLIATNMDALMERIEEKKRVLIGERKPMPFCFDKQLSIHFLPYLETIYITEEVKSFDETMHSTLDKEVTSMAGIKALLAVYRGYSVAHLLEGPDFEVDFTDGGSSRQGLSSLSRALTLSRYSDRSSTAPSHTTQKPIPVVNGSVTVAADLPIFQSVNDIFLLFSAAMHRCSKLDNRRTLLHLFNGVKKAITAYCGLLHEQVLCGKDGKLISSNLKPRTVRGQTLMRGILALNSAQYLLDNLQPMLSEFESQIDPIFASALTIEDTKPAIYALYQESCTLIWEFVKVWMQGSLSTLSFIFCSFILRLKHFVHAEAFSFLHDKMLLNLYEVFTTHVLSVRWNVEQAQMAMDVVTVGAHRLTIAEGYLDLGRFAKKSIKKQREKQTSVLLGLLKLNFHSNEELPKLFSIYLQENADIQLFNRVLKLRDISSNKQDAMRHEFTVAMEEMTPSTEEKREEDDE
ncbi:hypothetical protein PCE1_002180 [Barthelona sp. PCE]